MARYGIFSERFGDVFTDVFRVYILWLLGYCVDVMEFVGGEYMFWNIFIWVICMNVLVLKVVWEEYDYMCLTWGVMFFFADVFVEELVVVCCVIWV